MTRATTPPGPLRSIRTLALTGGIVPTRRPAYALPMLLGIDHLVIAAADPDRAADRLADALGLTVGSGGRHERLGTFNRLIWLGDSYLEIIGVFDGQMDVFSTSARVLDDGVIDPRDTRAVLSEVLAICREGDTRNPQAMQFSVARP